MDKDVKLSPEERETIIRGSVGSKTWDVVTADPKIMRKLERRGHKPEARKNPWGYKSYILPQSKVSFISLDRTRRKAGDSPQEHSGTIPGYQTDQALVSTPQDSENAATEGDFDEDQS